MYDEAAGGSRKKNEWYEGGYRNLPEGIAKLYAGQILPDFLDPRTEVNAHSLSCQSSPQRGSIRGRPLIIWGRGADFRE